MMDRGCYWCKNRKGLKCLEQSNGQFDPIFAMCASAGRKVKLESLTIPLWTTEMCIGNSCPRFIRRKIIIPEKVIFT